MMVSRPIIFFPVESPKRELDYKLNLARKFIKEGFDAIIGYPPFIRDELKYKNYKNCIFLEKGVNPTPDYYKRLNDKGILCFDYTDEGIGENMYSLKSSNAVKSLKLMKKIFLWGSAQKAMLTQKNGDSELCAKYAVVGSAAFDLSTKKFHAYHASLNPYQQYILINTNFGCYNNHGIEDELSACSARSAETLSVIKAAHEQQKREFPKFISLVDKLVENRPNLNFLIRPHPVEREDVYTKTFKKYSNVTVTKFGDINWALSKAQLQVHNDTTSALQAYLHNVPTISVANMIDRGSSHQHWSVSLGVAPTKRETLLEYVDRGISCIGWDSSEERKIRTAFEKLSRSYFEYTGSATERLIKEILNVYMKSYTSFQPYKLKDSRSVWQRIKHFIRKLLPLTYNISKTEAELLERVTRADVARRLEGLEKVDPVGCKYKLKELYPNSFWISEK